MDEVSIAEVIEKWNQTFCMYDPMEPEFPYWCVGADQHGMLYIYCGEDGEDMNWKLYQPAKGCRFFIIETLRNKGNICPLH